MAVYGEIGRLIQQTRRAKGVTQARLASAVGLSRTSVTNIERGRQKILVHTLYAIAETLGVDIHQLVAPGGKMRPHLEHQVPADVSPKVKKLISAMVQKNVAAP
jgi:transcriptional regulator with XRE-family HTH domain